MEWWDWLALSAGLLVALVAVAVWAVRRTARGRAIMALSLREKLRFGRALISDRDTPFVARTLLVLLIAYLALPFDLIPDFIPVAGQLDDLLIVALVLGLVLRLVPGERLDAAIAAARSA